MTNYKYAKRSEIIGDSVYDHHKNAIILSSGLAYPDFLPDIISETSKVLDKHKTEALQYGPLMGVDELRDAISEYLNEDGIQCTKENILITYGAKHALDLACRVFIEEGDKIIVTSPSYMTAIQIMRNHGVSFLSIRQDNEGLMTEELEKELERLKLNGERIPKMLFDVPDFHNPTGITMSYDRRKKLVQLAEKWNFIILEDDPYRRLRFEGAPIPPIKYFDQKNFVVGIGTFSKILAPGLRVGWAVGSKEIVTRMAMQKADGGSNPLSQRIVLEFLKNKKIHKHIDSLSEEMKKHRDVMVESFHNHLPEISIKKPNGGYFLWGELPKNIDAERLVELAIKEGVEISTGRICFPNRGPDNFIRLAYSFVSEGIIKEGVIRLAKAYNKIKQ
ncbi:PLP-dependent aminotransferase family protein [Alphaproteobacteria bacterium]|nr:PLP-dependent aminotransferase family protein [Alphaproteobacteria bacterium]